MASASSRWRPTFVSLPAMDFPAWDPVLLDIPGLPIDIRWYGMMYVVGFLVGQFVLVRPQVRYLPRLERGMQVAPVQVAVDAVLLDQALQQVECVDRDVEHLPRVGLAHLCD